VLTWGCILSSSIDEKRSEFEDGEQDALYVSDYYCGIRNQIYITIGTESYIMIRQYILYSFSILIITTNSFFPVSLGCLLPSSLLSYQFL
jgi:hypothetical protein